jgi:hypothetical protein
MRLGTTLLLLLLALSAVPAREAHAKPEKPTSAPKPTATMTPIPTATRTPTAAATRTPSPPAGGVSLSITDPAAGAVIGSDRFNVRGTFQGPPNTGVTVNDRVAYVSGGQFMLNSLPLAAGSNVITAVATTPTGQSATATVTVSATGASPDLVLNADVTSGASPLVVTFTYDFRSAQAVQKLAIDFDGDGRDDFSTRKPPMAVQNAYTRSGLYVATLTITDRVGQVHQAAVGIEVRAWDVRDALFRGVWDALTGALGRSDIEVALQPLNARARERYAPIFSELVADLPWIVASYSAPQFVSEGPGYLEYAVSRLIDGETRIFFVYLLRDADGVWRMDSF